MNNILNYYYIVIFQKVGDFSNLEIFMKIKQNILILYYKVN